MHAFFAETINQQKAILNQDETNHALKVLRLKHGEEVEVLNGKGERFIGQIGVRQGKLLEIDQLKPLEVFDSLPICSVAIAPPKNRDRFEWFLEKATEIGVHHIYPIETKRSERAKLNMERSKKILMSAVKQSKRSYLPCLHPIQTFSSFLSNNIENGFIAHCMATPNHHFKNQITTNQQVTILIGPEGDFTQDEINQSQKQGIKPISFGEVRFRTETAAILACNWVNFVNSAI